MIAEHRSLRFVRVALAIALSLTAAAPAAAQLRGLDPPPPDAPPGGVLGGRFCQDLATMLAILDQRGEAFRLAAETLRARPGAAALHAAETAERERDKLRQEAVPLRDVYALRCDRSMPRPAAMARTPRTTVPGQPAAGTPLGIEIPAQLAGTDGWVLMTDGTMGRPWRDDLPGQQVHSELWMYLTDRDGLIYAEPVISEVADGARFTMRMTCQQVAMHTQTVFAFEATVRNWPGRRYVAQGEIEVTGPMVIDNGAPGWPVRVRYAFSYQQRGDGGVSFADGGTYEGEGIARRLSDTARRMQSSTQTLEHACIGW